MPLLTNDNGNKLLSSNLCFDKSSFLKNDFKVDQFVAECRTRVQLEVLRQDLEVYFKILKNEMIVLINKDYADFVNLSSNLVGMDKAITQLRDPLKQIYLHVNSLKESICDRKTVFEENLNEQQILSEKQTQLIHMMGLVRAVEKVEQIISQEDMSTGQCLVRMASEFNQLQFHSGFCKKLPVMNHVRPRIADITSSLQQSLESVLLQGISDCDPTVLHRCLNSYALISKTKDAEKLVQSQLVHLFMQQIIEEHVMDNSPSNLKAFFDKTLDAVSQYIKMLCDVTSGRCESLGGQYRGIAGYDFMVNSVFPEIVEIVNDHMSSVYSPANPDAFHKNYNIAMKFVSSFEMQCRCQASVKRLRQSDSYNNFMTQWSLPVYFQIRFQEIGKKLEAAMPLATNNASGAHCRLYGTKELLECIELCWNKKVFLPPLLHRFWKLTLQLLSRFHHWMSTLLDTNNPSADTPPLTLNQFISLLHDISVTCEKVLEKYNSIIKDCVMAAGLNNDKSQSAALSEMLKLYQEFGKSITLHVITTMTAQSCVHLKQVQDVPRLYRRTNREAPSKASSYITSMIAPAKLFKEENECHNPEVVTEVLTKFFSDVTDSYFTVINDVLTSVRKMEESLQRLQKMRARNTAVEANQSVAQISDDDKIRMQLKIDIVEFGKKMEELNVKEEVVTKYSELRKMVEDISPLKNTQ